MDLRSVQVILVAYFRVGKITSSVQNVVLAIISSSNKNKERKIIEQVVLNRQSVASGGGGDAGTSPTLEIGKIVVEIWCYLREVYAFGAESEIEEIFSKKW